MGYVDVVRKLPKARRFSQIEKNSCLKIASGAGHMDVVSVLLVFGADARVNNDAALRIP